MKRILFIVFVCTALLSACGPVATEAPAPVDAPTQTGLPALTDASTPVEVTVGTTFTLVVAANGSTGYHWEMIGPLDDRYLEFVSREYRASEPVMPGSGGVEIWSLKGVAPGEALFVLGNYPPAQGETYQEEIHFTIIVK